MTCLSHRARHTDGTRLAVAAGVERASHELARKTHRAIQGRHEIAGGSNDTTHQGGDLLLCEAKPLIFNVHNLFWQVQRVPIEVTAGWLPAEA